MPLIKINPVAGKDYQDAWDTFDSNVDESITDLDVNGAGTQFRLKKFDGTYTSFKAITFPVATAANGLTLVGSSVRLGGTLTGGTTIDTSTFNFLLQSGTTAQRLRISNTFAEINGALELRISPPSIDASTAIVDQVLKVKNASTGRCEYEYIKSSDFTGLSIVGDKVRLTFKDASFIETSGLPQKSFGSFTKNNITTATTGLINVPTLIAGATTAGVLVDFTHNGLGRLTYTGATTKNFKIVKVSSLSTSAVNQVISTQIYKGGVTAQGIPSIENQISANVLQTRTTIAVVSLATNNFVECFATNTSGALNLTENYTTFTIEEI